MRFNFKSWPWQKYSLMFISLAIAVVMWVYVTNLEHPLQEREYNITLNPVNLPKGMVIEQIPERISIRVQSNTISIGGLSAERFKATVDLSNVTLGANNLPVAVDAPSQVTVTQINPDRVTVVVDKLVQKKVPVQLFLRGQPQPGFTIGEPVLTPTMVQASGPSKIINTIEQIPVTVDVTGVNQDLDYSLPLNIKYNKVKLSPASVRVVVPIEVGVPAKEVPVRVNVTGNLADGFEVAETTVKPAVVKVYAPERDLAQISEVTTKVLNIAGEDSYIKRTVELQLPPGTVLLQPNKVDVIVDIKKTTEQQETPPEPPANGQQNSQ